MPEKTEKAVCKKCGVLVKDIRRHKDRGRCGAQHIRKEGKGTRGERHLGDK